MKKVFIIAFIIFSSFLLSACFSDLIIDNDYFELLVYSSELSSNLKSMEEIDENYTVLNHEINKESFEYNKFYTVNSGTIKLYDATNGKLVDDNLIEGARIYYNVNCYVLIYFTEVEGNIYINFVNYNDEIIYSIKVSSVDVRYDINYYGTIPYVNKESNGLFYLLTIKDGSDTIFKIMYVCCDALNYNMISTAFEFKQYENECAFYVPLFDVKGEICKYYVLDKSNRELLIFDKDYVLLGRFDYDLYNSIEVLVTYNYLYLFQSGEYEYNYRLDLNSLEYKKENLLLYKIDYSINIIDDDFKFVSSYLKVVNSRYDQEIVRCVYNFKYKLRSDNSIINKAITNSNQILNLGKSRYLIKVNVGYELVSAKGIVTFKNMYKINAYSEKYDLIVFQTSGGTYHVCKIDELVSKYDSLKTYTNICLNIYCGFIVATQGSSKNYIIDPETLEVVGPASSKSVIGQYAEYSLGPCFFCADGIYELNNRKVVDYNYYMRIEDISELYSDYVGSYYCIRYQASDKNIVRKYIVIRK